MINKKLKSNYFVLLNFNERTQLFMICSIAGVWRLFDMSYFESQKKLGQRTLDEY